MPAGRRWRIRSPSIWCSVPASSATTSFRMATLCASSQSVDLLAVAGESRALFELEAPQRQISGRPRGLSACPPCRCPAPCSLARLPRGRECAWPTVAHGIARRWRAGAARVGGGDRAPLGEGHVGVELPISACQLPARLRAGVREFHRQWKRPSYLTLSVFRCCRLRRLLKKSSRTGSGDLRG